MYSVLTFHRARVNDGELFEWPNLWPIPRVGESIIGPDKQLWEVTHVVYDLSKSEICIGLTEHVV